MASEDEGIVRLFENLPVEIHVGQHPHQPESIIGFAHGHQTADGEAHIHITLHGEGGKKLGDLTEAFKLMSLGFAGVRRRPNGG